MLRVGEEPVLSRELSKGTEPEWILADLPPGEDLIIEADFGERLLFPCAVILGDPQLLRRPGGTVDPESGGTLEGDTP